MQIGAVGGDRIALDAEAAGSGGAERVDRAVKDRHPAREQEDEFRRRQNEIEDVKDFGGIAQTGDQLAHGRAGHLGAQDVDGPARKVRHDGDHQDQDAHAAHPVRKAPPEQQGVGHGFHVRQDRSAGRGEAGDGFKEGVDIAWDLAGQHEGDGADCGDAEPGEGGDQKALLGKNDLAGFAEEAAQRAADRRAYGDCDQKRNGAGVLIDQGDEQRDEQQGALQKDDAARHVIDHFSVHRNASVI